MRALSLSLLVLVASSVGCRGRSLTEHAFAGLEAAEWAAVLVDARSLLADDGALAEARRAGLAAVVLVVGEGDPGEEVEAARSILDAGLELHYWVEVARSPALADAHPGWMASVQGHPEWRRLFPDAPHPAENEVVKAYPWTPILYREVFEAQTDRVGKLLDQLPRPKGVLLNDLQGAPSACGCGHPLCRWTTDYGPKRTATRLGDDAAARFVRAIRERLPGSEVLPVWATECEEHDGAVDGACAGVGCYRGACWREYAKQLEPVVALGGRLGVLATYKALGRDLPIYGSEAGWVSRALESFEKLPPDGVRTLARSSDLVAVLQGWDVTSAQARAQVDRAREVGVRSFLLSLHPIDASWSPRVVPVRP